jgi:hypothetical protein
MQRALTSQVVDYDDMDDEIDRWHEGGTRRTLWDWLGMTREEYGRFATYPDDLPAIVEARRKRARTVSKVGSRPSGSARSRRPSRRKPD